MAHCEIGIVATWAVGSILSYSVVVDASRVKETVGSLPGCYLTLVAMCCRVPHGCVNGFRKAPELLASG